MFASASTILGAIAPPPESLTTTWGISAVELLRKLYDVPSIAAAALNQLDRFGAIRMRAGFVGFDHDDVEWSKTSAVRTRRLVDALTDSALDREVERLRKLLPPIPGRKRALEKAAGMLGDLSLAALDKAGSESLNRRVVSEIDYHGLLVRKKILTAGLTVSAVFGLYPAANRLVLSMSEQAGAQIHDQA